MTSLAITKLRALKAIDAAAEEVRRRLITDIAGQSDVYQDKRAEAKLYIAAHAVDPLAIPGPYLTADSSESGASALALANEVVAAADDLSTDKFPVLEAKRLNGKRRVRAATIEADVLAERDAAVAIIRTLFV